MNTDINFILENYSAATAAPLNQTAVFVEVVGIDIVIQLLAVITICTVVIMFHTLRTRRET